MKLAGTMPVSDSGIGTKASDETDSQTMTDASPDVIELPDKEHGSSSNDDDGTTRTELSEPENTQPLVQEVSVSHPLQYRWALWYLKADRSKDWEDCLKQVAVFGSVESFWSLYNHIQSASGLNWGSDYYLFKDGIKPMWEDENNVRGGRWLVVVDKQKRAQLLDHYWLELLMAIIGEQFEDHGEFICGAVVNVRQKGDKVKQQRFFVPRMVPSLRLCLALSHSALLQVSLWTRDSLRDDINLQIGQILKMKLDIPDSDPIRYEVHKDSSVRTSSMVKPRIIIPSKEVR
ncbi:unnamed protein product [Gongylonema pulchrum]|uniref:eIF-4F 25 kDa subunit n=1 Tax=Gongylonema pulchrum TaxID=637853 RepID=A0A183E346_9BILA|nr:unnamed protein product [Gongylonema pulchrum]